MVTDSQLALMDNSRGEDGTSQGMEISVYSVHVHAIFL